jgi:hypothetical protein
MAVESPYAPVMLRCRELPLPPSSPFPSPPDGHPPTSFPDNRTTRRRTNPRGPHGLVGYRETNSFYMCGRVAQLDLFYGVSVKVI